MTKSNDPNDRFDVRTSTTAFSENDAKALFLQEFGYDQEVTISRLSGGFRNANFLVQTSNGPHIIRFYSTGSQTCTTEADVIRLAKDHLISVPLIVKKNIKYKNHFANILKYSEGTTLSELLFRKSMVPDSVFNEIGRQLAFIHSVPFNTSGLLGPEAKVIHDTSDSQNVFNDFILAPLNGRAGIRLGTLKKNVLALIEKQWPQIGDTMRPCLVHCDFNPKNILINHGMDKVTILDWEFAMAGERLIDFGNFFRFETDYSQSMKDSFLEGYESVLSPLPLNWRMEAKIYDLVSMIHFLNSTEENPKTFATALEIIEETFISKSLNKL